MLNYKKIFIIRDLNIFFRERTGIMNKKKLQKKIKREYKSGIEYYKQVDLKKDNL